MPRDVDRLLRAMREQVPGCAGVTAVTPLSTGHSNETYLLEGASSVLRLPPSAQPLVPSAHDVLTQAAIFTAIAATADGPPVPSVRYTGADPTVTGDPFFVMDFAAGETFSEYAAPDWLTTADDAFRAAVVDNYLDAIADIHRLGTLPELGPVTSVRGELARWRALAGDADHKELLQLFDQLAGTAPDDQEATLVHGDPKPVNVLFTGTQVAAVLDWEMAFNGDPRWDLGYVLVFFPGALHPGFTSCDLPGMPDAEHIVARWRERAGRTADGWRWFEAASQAKIAAIMAYGHWLAASGATDDERLHAWAPYVEFFLSQARATADAHTTT